jgi:hypothetical protein
MLVKEKVVYIEKENAAMGYQMKLLDQVRDVIRKKHYSIRTEQAYVNWIRCYIPFHGKRHPKDMKEKEISQYLSYFAQWGMTNLKSWIPA